jgi:phosphoribosyl 1,2-cyclic phosphate phosphodiesterase
MGMILRILGTAAAEGWPALFCGCDACVRARRLGGRQIRRRASYQLGDTVHVDWGPDSYHSMVAFGPDYSTLRHLLITHSHWDHWVPQELSWRAPGFSQIPPDSHLTVYGNERVGRRLERELQRPMQDCRLSFRQIAPFDQLDLGTAIAVPLPATHAPGEQALMYLLQVGQAEVLIGHDSGWFADEVWDYLASRQLTAALVDCTYGTRDDRQGHMGGAAVVEAMQRLEKMGALAPGCRRIGTHISHNCGSSHEELVEFFAPYGIEVAYDGLELPL